MTGHHHADSWRAHVGRRLDEIRAALLDLIDAGVPDAPAVPRKPSKREQAATDTSDGEFRPTVPVSRRSTYSDPTGGEVLAWESEVQDATTRMFGAVTVAHEVADGLGLTPTDEDGRPLAAPVEPPTRRTLTDRLIVDASPRQCRTATLAAVVYVGAVADEVADRMVAAKDDDVGEAVDSRAGWLEAAVGQLAFRLAPPPPPSLAAVPAEETRPCACDRDDVCPHEPGECGNDVKVATRALACGTCRNRATAARKAASYVEPAAARRTCRRVVR